MRRRKHRFFQKVSQPPRLTASFSCIKNHPMLTPRCIGSFFGPQLVFDTDRNSLVDSFEVISCLAMLSMMTIKEKVDFIYSLYDFNGSGDITMDEMTILMRTLVTGCAKMDKKISPPSTEEGEWVFYFCPLGLGHKRWKKTTLNLQSIAFFSHHSREADSQGFHHRW